MVGEVGISRMGVTLRSALLEKLSRPSLTFFCIISVKELGASGGSAFCNGHHPRRAHQVSKKYKYRVEVER